MKTSSQKFHNFQTHNGSTLHKSAIHFINSNQIIFPLEMHLVGFPCSVFQVQWRNVKFTIFIFTALLQYILL